MTMFGVTVRRAATVRHSPFATKEMTPSERCKGILSVLGWHLAIVFGTVVTVLCKEWVLRALLLEASNEVPEGSGVVHVCD